MFLAKLSIFCILFVNRLAASDWYSRWKSDYRATCTESQMCIDKPIANANYFKAESAKFEKCKDARFCYNSESQIRLLDTSSLFLEYGCELKISDNSTMEMNGGSFFRISERSFVSNFGNITTYTAEIDLLSTSELKNSGKMILENKSSIIMNQQSELSLTKYSNIWLGSESAIKIEDHSWIKMEAEYSWREEGGSRDFHLMNKSKLELFSGSSLIQSGGQIVMSEGSSWKILKGGKVKLHCVLQISKDSTIFVEGEMLIGIIKEKREEVVGNTSLIFVKNGISLIVNAANDLWLTNGAHCLLKQSFVAGTWQDKVQHDTKNEYFDCYSTRVEAIEALVSWNITMATNL